MTFNQTPSAERIHIGIFGKRNAGKSSPINALAGQPVSIVSDFKGTTTDPVKKSNGAPSSGACCFNRYPDWMTPGSLVLCVSKNTADFKYNRYRSARH